jgi:hypothetical protein
LVSNLDPHDYSNWILCFDFAHTAVHLTTHRDICLSARGTGFGALCAYGFFGFVGTTGVLSASVLGFVVWDGGLLFSGIS